MVDMKEHKRFPRIWPAKFRNRLGDYLMQVSLTGSSFVLYKHGHRMCAITPVQPGAKGVPITPSKYRHHSSEIIARVRWAKERFLIVKRGRKLAWIRPVEDVGIKERESL
jgi:hypothetical protein